MTGRFGYTWEAIPGMTFYSQYATGADVSANNIFLLGALQPLDLTTSRTYETGVKQLFWDNKAEWSFSAFDILRKNVYAAAGGMQLNIAGQQQVQGYRDRGRDTPHLVNGNSGAISLMSMRAMRIMISPADRFQATRPRTCRESSPMPAHPIALRPHCRSNSGHRFVMSATASTPTPTRSRSTPIRLRTPMSSLIFRSRFSRPSTRPG